MTFGEKIKNLREGKKMSQRALGENLGVTQQTIAQYEKIQDTPKLATVRKIATALGVTISELVDDWGAFTPSEIFEDLSDNEEDYSTINPRAAVEEQAMLEKYRTLNAEGREKVMDHIKLLMMIHEYHKDYSPWEELISDFNNK